MPALSPDFDRKPRFLRVEELARCLQEDPGDTYLVRKLVNEELPRLLVNLRDQADRCSCGHVTWAHWPNGRCAHCDCEEVDV